MLTPIRRSLRRKVVAVVLVTTFAALLVSTLVLVTYEVENYRGFLTSDITTQAEMLGRMSAPALAVGDRATAEANLAFLDSRRDIIAAALYTPDGEVLASYQRGSSRLRFPSPGSSGDPKIADGTLTVFHRVIEDGQMLGYLYIQASYEVIGRLRDYLPILITVMLVSLLVAAFISLWLEGSVTNAVLAVTSVARKVIEERDFTLRAPRTTDDEIGVLVDAFNAMLAEVGQRTEALEASNRRLQEESDERKSAEAALRLADQRKDEFLATLAHELRNPLAPMVNAVGLLSTSKLDPAVAKRAHEIIDRQLAHLVRLVDDLLDVSRITSGKLAVRKQSVELANVVQNAIDTVRPLLEARQHALDVQLPQQPVYLQADPVRLSQVFSNLLNNAAKYSDIGCGISLTANVTGSVVRIAVTDKGIGISPETLPAIFDMFTQGSSSVERMQAGLGVGLALAKRLIDLHGGTIEAQSPGPGLGSTFIVQLPVMAALTATRAQSAPLAASERNQHHRILLVDDNVDFATSLSLLLRGLGHDVRTAHDAGEALAAARDFQPDFGILDLGLPQVSGYDLARELRKLPETANTVLIALSGWGQPQDRQRSLEAGFALHLVKPVELARIQSVLQSLAQ